VCGSGKPARRRHRGRERSRPDRSSEVVEVSPLSSKFISPPARPSGLCCLAGQPSYKAQGGPQSEVAGFDGRVAPFCWRAARAGWLVCRSSSNGSNSSRGSRQRQRARAGARRGTTQMTHARVRVCCYFRHRVCFSLFNRVALKALNGNISTETTSTELARLDIHPSQCRGVSLGPCTPQAAAGGLG
jgi:hypothetical protein